MSKRQIHKKHRITCGGHGGPVEADEGGKVDGIFSFRCPVYMGPDEDGTQPLDYGAEGVSESLTQTAEVEVVPDSEDEQDSSMYPDHLLPTIPATQPQPQPTQPQPEAKGADYMYGWAFDHATYGEVWECAYCHGLSAGHEQLCRTCGRRWMLWPKDVDELPEEAD